MSFFFFKEMLLLEIVYWKGMLALGYCLLDLENCKCLTYRDDC